MKVWEILLGVAGIVMGLLPYVMSPEGFRGWMLTRGARGRRKKRQRLEARKTFLTALHDSPVEQARYLLQGALIVVATVAAVVVLGVQMEATWPWVVPGFAWACAWGIYFFAMYRLGVDRRVRKVTLFEKGIRQIDERLAVLQVIESFCTRHESESDF